MKYLAELKELNLPADEYAVFGSGVLAIRGIRENNDLDIIVKERLWSKLAGEYFVEKNGAIKTGNIEIWDEKGIFPSVPVNAFIDNADIIKGVRYVQLEDVVKFKKLKNRRKDREDVQLIEDYLNQHNNQSDYINNREYNPVNNTSEK